MRTLNDYLVAAEATGRATFTPCLARPAAHCYSFIPKDSETATWSCSESAEECRAGQSQMPRVAREVTACRVVP